MRIPRNMKVSLLFAAILMLGVAWNTPAAGSVQPDPTLRSSQVSDAVDQFMQDATGDCGYIGGVSLVIHNGKLIHLAASGYRDLERREPVHTDDIFRIYSMTKPVTSVALMLLVDEGKLDLGDRLDQYVPEFALVQVLDAGPGGHSTTRPPRSPITLRELLTHTAGFPAGLPGDAPAAELQLTADPHGAHDLRGFTERLATAPLAADPGTRFAYDGAATEVIARVVEVVSGESFADFLQKRIFDPLLMPDTGFRVPHAQRHRVVDITTMDDTGHLRIADGVSAATPGEPLRAYSSGAGGLYSTAGDYARFARMLLNGGTLDGAQLLSHASVAAIMGNQLAGVLDPPVNQFNQGEGFGLGGYVVLDPVRRGQLGSVGQFGWAGAASTTFTVDPEEQLIAILLLQHLPRDDVSRDLPRISREFYNLVYGSLRQDQSVKREPAVSPPTY